MGDESPTRLEVLKIDSSLKTNMMIRNAQTNEAQEIHHILSEAFESYREYYTEEAYKATILSPSEITIRISDKEKEVFVVLYENEIVGTVTIRLKGEAQLHIQSMAVRPNRQRRGVGKYILEEIICLGTKKQVKTLSLECFEPLKKVMTMYKKFGFRRTGKKRNLHGNEIFEMTKRLEPVP
ncbi:MAG: GNAT family N-acetyltransferase [Candidatus Heimdallarchaeota archaeon]